MRARANARAEATDQRGYCKNCPVLRRKNCSVRTAPTPPPAKVGALRLLVAAYPDGLHEADDDGLLPIDETDIRTVEVATAVW